MSVRPSLESYSHLAGGKVRDLYVIDDEHLLLVASDRISAYDHILDTPIPDKGRVLTAMSVFFFNAIDFPNHLAGPIDDPRIPEEVLGRALIVKKLKMLPFECVARGYLTGSGLKEYQADGTVCGIELPDGLVEASKLPEPIFTPATKAQTGHDENISFERMVEIVGSDVAEELRRRSIAIFQRGAEYARSRGIIIADTKFEWGRVGDELILIDEVLTPDSSRFWPADQYQAGRGQPSFDKQFVRDWLETTDWDKNSPPPALPDDVVTKTRQKYVDAYECLTGQTFAG